MLANFISYLKTLINSISLREKYIPIYRVVDIHQVNDHYEVTVQIINESNTFLMRPEEILADDKFVDLFSPRDIRTLTYLGYLGINSPKYKILANRLSENSMIFALRKKGDSQILIKSANEIFNEKEILKALDPKDSNLVVYTVATESISREKVEMQKLIKNNSVS